MGPITQERSPFTLGSRGQVAGPVSGSRQGGRGESPAAWKHQGPGNPAKPAQRSNAGRPGLSPAPSAWRPPNADPPAPPSGSHRGKQVGVEPGPGPEGAAGAPEEREAPAEVWAAPARSPAPRPRPGLGGRCPRASAQLPPREAEPGASPTVPGRPLSPATRARRPP